MNFQDVKQFLESWGLHYDTPDGVSNDIPYPQVYGRMRSEAWALGKGNPRLYNFIERITDTTDGRTYLTPESWAEVENAWNQSS